MTKIQELVEYYKLFKSSEVEAEGGNKAWDKRHFARFSRDAKILLSKLGSIEAACLAVKWMSEQGYEWTLQTIATKKYAQYMIYFKNSSEQESRIGKFY
jgi:hypothetical protein